jgi:hypothetical protein
LGSTRPELHHREFSATEALVVQLPIRSSIGILLITWKFRLKRIPSNSPGKPAKSPCVPTANTE